MNNFPQEGYIKNRYYDRGSKPTCCDDLLRYSSKEYGNMVVSSNNPYSNDNPSFAQYLTFSNFKDRVLTLQDIETILFYYNKNYLLSDKQHGPFQQVNLNFVGQMGYNENAWNQYWKNYKASNHYEKSIVKKNVITLQDVSYDVSVKFLNKMNEILSKLNNNTQKFQLSKHKIINIFRSTTANNIKFKLNVILTRDTRSKIHTFEVYGYFNPSNNTLYLGKAAYVGSGTTDNILLPNGYNKLLYTGRPLHEVAYKESQLMPHREVKRLFFENLQKKPSFYSFDNSLPYWYRVFTER